MKPISGPFEALGSQSHHFSGKTKAGSRAPVSPCAQIAIEAGALASVGFVTFNMEKCPQIMVPFLLPKVSSLTVEIDSNDKRIMENSNFSAVTKFPSWKKNPAKIVMLNYHFPLELLSE